MGMPKQFVIVDGKPIIIHTLEVFNRNRQIDDIVLVIVDGWQTVMERYLEEFNIAKVRRMVVGGETGQESIRNGVEYLQQKYSPEDIILIHDAVRPLVTDEVINSNIRGVLLNGTAITVIPVTEALLHTDNRLSSSNIVDRYTTLRTQTPQSLRLSLLSELHRDATQKDIRNSVATCTLLIELGHEVHFANGDSANFKITTESDIRLLDAYLKSRKMVPWRES